MLVIRIIIFVVKWNPYDLTLASSKLNEVITRRIGTAISQREALLDGARLFPRPPSREVVEFVFALQGQGGDAPKAGTRGSSRDTRHPTQDSRRATLMSCRSNWSFIS